MEPAKDDAQRPPLILVVDDDTVLNEELSTKLKNEGFNVISAVNGRDGLVKAEANKPDLTLLDVNMPDMDGITMLKALRVQSWGKDLKVIMLTNQSDTETVFDSIKENSAEYLTKSDWQLDDIIGEVRNHLAKA